MVQGRFAIWTYLPAELPGNGLRQFAEVRRDRALEQFAEPRIFVDAWYDAAYDALILQTYQTLVDLVALEGRQEIIGAP